MPNPPPARGETFTGVLRVRGFAAMWLAQCASVAGDQLARVALALLVFQRTGSPGATAVAWAVPFLADLLGGLFLSGLADRYPQRLVMVAADLLRAALVAVMLVPGTQIWGLYIAVFAVQLASAPFTAARMAAVTHLLPGDGSTVGVGILNTTYQVALLVGLPLGGVVAVWLGVRGALTVDVATFLVSAALLAAGMPAVPRRQADVEAVAPRPWRQAWAGVRVITRAPRLRALLGIALVAGFYIAPEAVVVPYAGQIGAGAGAIGWLLAANPVGTVIGNLVLGKWVSPSRRLWLLGPLAVASAAVLLPSTLQPGLAWSLVLWTLCGLASSHDMVTSAEFVRSVPAESRGQAFGLAASALRAAQGVGIVLTGLVAQAVGPAAAITIAAALGTVTAVAAANAWRRVSRTA